MIRPIASLLLALVSAAPFVYTFIDGQHWIALQALALMLMLASYALEPFRPSDIRNDIRELRKRR